MGQSPKRNVVLRIVLLLNIDVLEEHAKHQHKKRKRIIFKNEKYVFSLTVFSVVLLSEMTLCNGFVFTVCDN